MKKIIQWLRQVEHLANDVYSQAAEVFADDPEFRKFLEHTAEDEAWHYHVMGSAADYLSSEPLLVPALSIDSQTNEKVIKCFLDMRDGLKGQTIKKEQFVEKMLEAEFSEWNDIFLYVVNSLKERTGEFKYPAVRMQAHIRDIAHYIETVERQPGALDRVNSLTPLWIENILIVDDMPAISGLIKDLLSRDGNIDTAGNGVEALELIDKKYYKLVVSDIDMPVMDGLALYTEATNRFPRLKTKFLFITGDLSRERQCFFTENKIECLTKPMDISQLRDAAVKILFA